MESRERRRDGNKTSTTSVCDNMKAGGAGKWGPPAVKIRLIIVSSPKQP